MIQLIRDKTEALAALCRRFGVERMSVFGSAATGDFRPESSDIDFLVRLAKRAATADYAHRYLDLADELERLFGLRVDLVTEESVENPYLRETIEATRQAVYDS